MNENERGYFLLSQTAAETAGNSLRILRELEPSEVLSLHGRDLLNFEIGVDFREMAEFDRLRDPAVLDALFEETEKKGLRFLCREDPDFPEEFLALPDPPAGIYVQGRLPKPDQQKVSIVGSRRCSEYGRECAYFFGKELSKYGVNIVSGMALGVDGYAGRGALSAADPGGFPEGHSFTTAILGGGADLCYPKENVGLFRSILDQGGCILSEKPAGYQAKPYDFPKRNRLISAYGSCLAVIEAAERSGTRTTVDFALALGKEVFAVPGRIGERMSLGCNELIKNGAHMLTCPEDILQNLGFSVKADTKKPVHIPMTPEEKEIYDCIGSESVMIDDLLLRSNFPVSMILEILVRLEMKGAIRKSALSGYVRVQDGRKQ